MKTALINAAIREKGISRIMLADKVGCSLSMLSRYLTGQSEPPQRKLVALADALELDVAEVLEDNDFGVKPLSVQAAAKALHKSPIFIEEGLKQRAFPWGYAVQIRDGVWSFWINPKKFQKELTGE